MTPGKYIPNINLLKYDKIGHFTIFFIHAYLIVAGIFKNSPNIKKTLITGLIICLSYGFLTEFSQNFIPRRRMEIGDLTANIVGVLAGTIFFLIKIKITALFKKKKS